MKTGRFEEAIENSVVLDICHHILDEPIIQISQICERYGSEENEVGSMMCILSSALPGKRS